jgi:hypothetical protein
LSLFLFYPGPSGNAWRDPLIVSHLPSTRKPAAALAAAMLALSLSACGSQATIADLDERVIRAEAAAQKAIAAQQAAESAAARIRRAETDDTRREDEDSNDQDSSQAGGGDDQRDEEPAIAAAPEA